MRCIQFIFLLIVVIACTRSSPQLVADTPGRDALKQLVETIDNDPNYLVEGVSIFSSANLVEFYQKQQYYKVWFEDDAFTTLAKDLIEAVQHADQEGLTPSDYHISQINDLITKGVKYETSFLHLEVLLTDAYLSFASHLYSGKVCPEKVDPEWHATCKEVELDHSGYLAKAISDRDILGSLDRLKPQHVSYKHLKEALAHYRKLETNYHGGLPNIEPKPNLITNYNLLNINYLEERLLALGDLSEQDKNDPEKLAEAVSQFQHRHGFSQEGMIDSLTVKALNTSIAERIQTIEINLERWRWLPLELGERYILVNIANFSLEVNQRNKITFQSGVIVGTPFHRTPVFDAQMTHMILKPYWHVPRSIIKNEILTLADPVSYLTRNQISILDRSGKVVSADSINWSQVKTGDFPYRLRQEPGMHNSLGLIKFMFPNPYSVYIHDTPTKKLFERPVRTFSHGCIRLQKPFELAEYLLIEQPTWDKAKLQEVTANSEQENVRIDLPTPFPVYVLYWTAWMDNQEHIHFRDDIYERDQAVWKALKEPLETLL